MVDGQLVFGQLCEGIRSVEYDGFCGYFLAGTCADGCDFVAFDVQMRFGISKVRTDDELAVLSLTADRLCFQRIKVDLDHILDALDGDSRTVDRFLAEIDDINELAGICIADHLAEALAVCGIQLDFCRSCNFLKGGRGCKPGEIRLLAFDSGRQNARAPHLTAVCKELLQQFNGGCINGIKGRNNDIVVGAQTDTDLAALNGAHLRHHAFIAPVIGNLCLRQLV